MIATVNAVLSAISYEGTKNLRTLYGICPKIPQMRSAEYVPRVNGNVVSGHALSSNVEKGNPTAILALLSLNTVKLCVETQGVAMIVLAGGNAKKLR